MSTIYRPILDFRKKQMYSLNKKSIKHIKIEYKTATEGPETYKDVNYYRKRIHAPKKWNEMLR